MPQDLIAPVSSPPGASGPDLCRCPQHLKDDPHPAPPRVCDPHLFYLGSILHGQKRFHETQACKGAGSLAGVKQHCSLWPWFLKPGALSPHWIADAAQTLPQWLSSHQRKPPPAASSAGHFPGGEGTRQGLGKREIGKDFPLLLQSAQLFP